MSDPVTTDPAAPVMAPAVVPDIRRRIAFVTQGVTRILVSLQALAQDIDGALADGQYLVAAVAGRAFFLEVLAIRSAATVGELQWAPEAVSFTPFAGATPHERQQVLDAMDEGLRVCDEESARRWRATVSDHLDLLIADLGLGEHLPILRSPEGMFQAIRLARGAFELVDRMALAPVLPASWSEVVTPK
jgi:hypothetical protein